MKTGFIDIEVGECPGTSHGLGSKIPMVSITHGFFLNAWICDSLVIRHRSKLQLTLTKTLLSEG